MSIDATTIKSLVEKELGCVSDTRVLMQIRKLLVEPNPIMRDWDYGEKGVQYACWAVLDHEASNTGIAYCEGGFGPRWPWGLVALRGEECMSIGMDCGWFSSFLNAYFDSYASAELPIYRVFKTGPSGIREPITGENSWDATWEQVHALRKSDPESLYDCDHSIVYQHE